jgi:hypothetical protein
LNLIFTLDYALFAELVCVSGYSTKAFSTDDILKKPVFVITHVNREGDELNGYVAEGGLSALASDPKGKETYEALRLGDGTALLIQPSVVSPVELQSAAATALASPLRLPDLATLALLVATSVGIPWLLSGSTKKNSTNTTFKHGGYLLKLCRLEMSDDSVRILEGLNQLPASIIRNE